MEGDEKTELHQGDWWYKNKTRKLWHKFVHDDYIVKIHKLYNDLHHVLEANYKLELEKEVLTKEVQYLRGIIHEYENF